MTEVNDSEREFLTALKSAVGKGDVVIARRLIKGGVDVNKKYWYDGTLLHEAVASGHVQIVKLLLQAKADVHAINKNGATPLHLAARIGNNDMVQQLLKAGTDVNRQTLEGRTPLHVATWRRHKAVMNTLLSAGADPNTLDSDGWSPLQWAVNGSSQEIRCNSLEMTRTLIESGAQINTKDKNGRTPFKGAVSQANLVVAKYLIKEGADCVSDPIDGMLMDIMIGNCESGAVKTDFIKLLLEIGYSFRAVRGAARPTGTSQCSLSKEMAVFLETCRAVPGLQSLCRRTVRHRLMLGCGGQSITSAIKDLDIPAVLRDYLTLPDVRVVI